MLPTRLGLKTLDDLRSDVGRRVSPCDKSFILVDHNEQTLILHYSRKCGAQPQRKCIFGLATHSEEFRLGILDESLNIHLETIDLALALLTRRGRQH